MKSNVLFGAEDAEVNSSLLFINGKLLSTLASTLDASADSKVANGIRKFLFFIDLLYSCMQHMST